MAKKSTTKKSTKKAPKPKPKVAKPTGAKKTLKWQATLLNKVRGIARKSPLLRDKEDEDIIGEYKEYLAKEYKKYPKEDYPSRDEETYWRRAFTKFRGKYKKALRSSATPWLGKIVGVKAPNDMMAKKILEQIGLAKTNLTKALKEGLIMFTEEKDDIGAMVREPIKDDFGKYIARDTRETFNKKDKNGNLMVNRNHGKPMQHSWNMQVFVICAPEDGSKDVNFATLNVRGVLAEPGKRQLSPPIGNDVRFMALDRTPDPILNDEGEITWEPEFYTLNSSSSTKFDVLPDNTLPVSIAKLFKAGFMQGIAREANDLEDFYNENATKEDGKINWDMVVFTRGDVSDIGLEKTGSGNKWFRMERTAIEGEWEDLDTGFGEEDEEEIPDSLQILVPDHLQKFLDFAESSVVYVVGRPSKMPKQDADRNPIVDEDNQPVLSPVSIFAYGIWADPEYKEEIDHEDVEDNTEEIDDEASVKVNAEENNEEESDEEDSEDSGEETLEEKW